MYSKLFASILSWIFYQRTIYYVEQGFISKLCGKTPVLSYGPGWTDASKINKFDTIKKTSTIQIFRWHKFETQPILAGLSLHDGWICGPWNVGSRSTKFPFCKEKVAWRNSPEKVLICFLNQDISMRVSVKVLKIYANPGAFPWGVENFLERAFGRYSALNGPCLEELKNNNFSMSRRWADGTEPLCPPISKFAFARRTSLLGNCHFGSNFKNGQNLAWYFHLSHCIPLIPPDR